MLNILCGDALEKLRELPDESVQMCVTSPPYYGLRDYGIAGQIGLELSLDDYTYNLNVIFQEVGRVLKNDGTLWVNLGDSYYNYRPGLGQSLVKQTLASSEQDHPTECNRRGLKQNGLKEKDLMGVPWRVAFALQEFGWYLRQDIIWSKPSCMPESVKDRCTRSHEYIFMFSKNRKYFYNADAIAEPAIYNGNYKTPDGWDTSTGNGGHGSFHKEGREKGFMGYEHKPHPDSIEARKLRASMDHKAAPSAMKNGIRPYSDKQRGHSRRHDGFNDRWDEMEKKEQCSGMRNKRSVWVIGPDPFPEAHFATFPEELPTLCILAGSKEGDVVVDPFGGAGTTGLAALKLGRSAILIDLNPKYIENDSQKNL